MSKAKEYFDKEYDKDHIQYVIDNDDIISIYGLIDEYVESMVNKHKEDVEKAIGLTIEPEQQYSSNPFQVKEDVVKKIKEEVLTELGMSSK